MFCILYIFFAIKNVYILTKNSTICNGYFELISICILYLISIGDICIFYIFCVLTFIFFSKVRI